MNDYQKVLLILGENKKLTLKANALLKISISTTDRQLRELAACASRYYPRYIFLNDDQKEEIANLRKYCENMIQYVKPAWQVEAERHGWVPGKKA